MKKLSTIFLGLLLVGSTFAAEKHPNLSGRWELDKLKSQGLPSLWAGLRLYSMVIEQNGAYGQLRMYNKFIIMPAPADRPGHKYLPTPLAELTYYLDGREVTIPELTSWTPLSRTQSARWQEEKLILTNRFETVSPTSRKTTWTMKEVWELSNNGKILTDHQTISGILGTQETTLVFNKR